MFDKLFWKDRVQGLEKYFHEIVRNNLHQNNQNRNSLAFISVGQIFSTQVFQLIEINRCNMKIPKIVPQNLQRNQ